MDDRYDNLELDLECDTGGGGGGSVAHKASLFGGMFKKSTKSTTEQPLIVHSEDNLSMNGELSRSNESLTNNNNDKDKTGGLKGMFKKQKSTKDPAQASLSYTNPELSISADSLTESKPSKDKALGAPPKPPPRPPSKPGHHRRASQDFLDFDRTSSTDNLAENTATKESSGMFGGMFKKSPKPSEARRPSQDNLSTSSELSGSQDSLTVNNNKEGGGVFSGMFKKSPKIFTRTQSQDDLSDPTESTEDLANQSENTKEKGGLFSGVFKKPKGAKSQSQEDLTGELSGSKEELSDNNNTKEKGGILSGVFKKPKLGARSQSKDDLTADGERSNSQENLSENNTKEKGGILSGVFKKPKLGARSQSKEDLTADGELSNSQENLAENNNKEKAGFFGGMFKKQKGLGAKSQSQDDLSESSELSGSTDNLAEKSSKGGVAKILKNPFASSAQKEDKEEKSDKNEASAKDTEKPKAKQNGFSAMMKSTFYSDKQEKDSDSETEDDGENQQSGKQQSKFAGAMTKLNPFKSAHKSEKSPDSSDDDTKEENDKHKEHKQKDAEKQETPKDNEKEEKPKTVKKKVSQFEQRDRSETIMIPSRTSRTNDKENTRAPSHDKVGLKGAGDKQDPHSEAQFEVGSCDSIPDMIAEENLSASNDDLSAKEKKSGFAGLFKKTPKTEPQVNKEMASKEKRPQASETRTVPPRPSAEDMNRAQKNQDSEETVAKHGRLYPTLNKSDDEALNEDKEEEKKPVKVRRPKHHNPFMPRTGAKLAAVETAEEAKEAENDETSNQEENNDEDGGEKAEAKAKKPKRRNPFMPQVKAKANRKAQDEDEGDKTLFDRLEEFRFEPSQPENSDDVENLMDWWNTVENWEDTPQFDDMTPKEEAKAFAVTAEKIQKGIRVFNKLFTERAESLWQHVIDLNAIADGLDKFNKKTKIAQITGGSTSATGGVLTITGLALAPVTMGTSLIVTAVGLGIATAGGLTSAGAGISNQVNNSMDRKKVEKIVEDYQEKMVDLNKALKFIKQGIENLRQFDLIKMKKHAYNNDFPVLNSRFYEDGAMAGKAILINANEIMRVVQIANVAGSTAARAVQIASMATGVLTGLFVGMDIYFVAKDSKELKKGAKSEFAAKIREVATQLHDGLVELNTIREELQSTTKPKDDQEGAQETGGEKKEVTYDDEEEEDEIDRIKKQIKKDYENREWV